MSSTELQQRPYDQDSGVPDICHLVRDDEDLVALCGKRLLGIPATSDDELCVVCSDLALHGI